jgi:hypothetical protein
VNQNWYKERQEPEKLSYEYDGRNLDRALLYLGESFHLVSGWARAPRPKAVLAKHSGLSIPVRSGGVTAALYSLPYNLVV